MKTNTTSHKKNKNFPAFSTRSRPTHQNESLLICIRCHGQNTNRIEISGCVDLRRETILIRYLLSIKKQYFNRMMFFLADISSKKFKKCSYPVYNSRQVFLVVHLHEQFFELDKFFLSRKSWHASFCLTRKTCQVLLIYTSNFFLSRKTCQGKLARVNEA